MTAALPSAPRKISLRQLVAIALLLPSLAPATTTTNRPVERFEVGLARSCFPNINHNDAVAAYRVMLEKIGRRLGYEISSSVTIHEDTPQFIAAIKQRAPHLSVMDAWQFLEMEPLPEIRPFFVTAMNGELGRRYLVIVRRDSVVRTVADLRGRTVVLLDAINNGVCRNWIESLLPDDPASPTAAFFDSLEGAAKPTTAVLPVFFGQKAACIVDEGSFNLMKELNPQVGRDLEVIATSDAFVDIVLCLSEQNWPSPESKAEAVRAMIHLADDPAGRQMLNLFKISAQIPFQEKHLATIRALRRTVEQRQSSRLANTERP